MDVEAVSSGESFSTKTKLVYVKDDFVLTEAGKSLVYTGYAWRGRSNADKPGATPNDPSAMREVMMLSRDQSQLEGRWFWGAYQEFGMDVKMRRATAGPTVLGVDVYSLKSGTTGGEVRIYGDHFPTDISVADLDLGTGVSVKKLISHTPETIKVSVDVSSGATPGKRDVAVRNVVAPAAFAVYDHIDYLKVSPQTPLSHLGSEPHAKGYSQFDAIAYANGPDGKEGTADDIELGPVNAKWTLEEFVATIGDDDVDFVGNLDPASGLFTPALDGPNPKRKFSRNNYGDVWVVATFKPAGSDHSVTGRSYLIVAVPQYMRWDQPEVAQ
jgi:quinohemoprotein amine dehydrogenase